VDFRRLPAETKRWNSNQSSRPKTKINHNIKAATHRRNWVQVRASPAQATSDWPMDNTKVLELGEDAQFRGS
jgi:hypothetical protein